MKTKKFRLEVNETPIREGVFLFPKNEDDSPHLVGSRCRTCGDVVFPKRHLCTVCDSQERMEEMLLGEKGTLNTYTVVRVGYPHFDLPYILALVDLPEGRDLQVLAQIEDCDPSALRIGMPLELTLGKIKTDPRTGKTVIGYKYRPAGT